MKKRSTPADEDPTRPFFKCYPSNLLSGCISLSAEEKGVYYTLLFKLYDSWEAIDDGTVKQRQYLARLCGTTTRGFTTIRDRLLTMPEKLTRTPDGLLTNPRFEREKNKLGTNRSQIDDEKSGSISKINGGLNEAGDNENKGLDRASCARESRVQSPDSTVQAQGTGLGHDAEQVIESEIQQICRAIGVDLQASTKRAFWPYHWTKLRTDHNLTVGDMVAAIESYTDQFKGEQVRSLGMFKDRAIEKRVARELSERLTTKRLARAHEHAVQVSDKEWHARLVVFLRIGTWSSSYGPSPLQPGCVAPAGLLDLAEEKWKAQGSHPELMQIGQHRQAWKQGQSDPIRKPIDFAERSK